MYVHVVAFVYAKHICVLIFLFACSMFTGISEYMCARIRAYAYGFAYSAGDRTLAAAFRAADRLNEWENGPREGRKEGSWVACTARCSQHIYV